MQITKETRMLEAMQSFPEAAAVFRKHGIKSAGVFETLEKAVAHETLKTLLDELNKGLEEYQKPKQIDPETIFTITERAASELKKSMQAKGKGSCGLRFGVHSPSPNQYSYYMDFEKKPDKKKDLVVEKFGLKVFVAKSDVSLLKGSCIEYDEKECGFKISKKS